MSGSCCVATRVHKTRVRGERLVLKLTGKSQTRCTIAMSA